MAKKSSKINLKKVAKMVLDELKVKGVAMDGAPDALSSSGNAGGWLQPHDDRYHGGHYEEGQTCKLREKLKATDNADRLEGATNGMTNVLANAPTQEQYTSLITRLRERGILDSRDTNDLLEMYHSLQSALVNGDEEDFELSDDLKNNIRDIYDVYQALSDAYGDAEGDEGVDHPSVENVQEHPVENRAVAAEEHRQVDDEQRANGNDVNAEGLADIDIQDAIRRLEDEFGHNQRIREGVLEALRTGNVDPSYMREATRILGDDDPVIRAINARRGASEMRQNEQGASEDHNQTSLNQDISNGENRIGKLSSDSFIANGEFENAQITSSAQGMKIRPENIKAKNVNAAYMANLCARLPNIFSSSFAGRGNRLGRDGSVTISGFGTMSKTEAWKKMLSDPDSEFGKELFGRLDRWVRENPNNSASSYVAKLRKAMTFLPYRKNNNATFVCVNKQIQDAYLPAFTSRDQMVRIIDGDGDTDYNLPITPWSIDERLMGEGQSNYRERKRNGQTSELEDRFARFGLFSAPQKILPITKKSQSMTCFACHAVAVMRALFNIPAIPGSFGGDISRGKVWAQVRTNAFPGAIPLINRQVANREMNSAPVGSVIMHSGGNPNADRGGHCWAYQKLKNGKWRALELYGSHISKGKSAQEAISEMTFPTQENLQHLISLAPRRRRSGMILDSVTDEQVAMAGIGSLLITPEIAANCNPEYLTGAVTGTPFRSDQMSNELV